MALGFVRAYPMHISSLGRVFPLTLPTSPIPSGPTFVTAVPALRAIFGKIVVGSEAVSQIRAGQAVLSESEAKVAAAESGQTSTDGLVGVVRTEVALEWLESGNFQFASQCAGEWNVIRASVAPIVFQHREGDSLLYGTTKHVGALRFPFDESSIVQDQHGFLFHPAPAGGGGLGLLRSELAVRLMEGRDPDEVPTIVRPTHLGLGEAT